MSDKTHTVRFEPVGIEIEVDESETILNAAFRQGIMLMHGCKEGQCSACKSFILDGEVDLDRYSTFALPDFEEAEGWTLLCRAHPYSDLEIELINYDEEIIHGGPPPDGLHRRRGGRGADLGHPASSSPSEPLEFKPGQYVDITVPGTDRSPVVLDGQHRPDTLEFMIKHYEGGRFSGLLERCGLKPGDTLDVTGPYGVFTLRAQFAAAAAVHRRRRRHGADPLAPAASCRPPRRAREAASTTAPAPRPTSSDSTRLRRRRCGFRSSRAV